MNEFINCNAQSIIFVALIALILGILLGFYTIEKHHIQLMTDKGYIEQALPGTTKTIWVKDNGCY